MALESPTFAQSSLFPIRKTVTAVVPLKLMLKLRCFMSSFVFKKASMMTPCRADWLSDNNPLTYGSFLSSASINLMSPTNLLFLEMWAMRDRPWFRREISGSLRVRHLLHIKTIHY